MPGLGSVMLDCDSMPYFAESVEQVLDPSLGDVALAKECLVLRIN